MLTLSSAKYNTAQNIIYNNCAKISSADEKESFYFGELTLKKEKSKSA